MNSDPTPVWGILGMVGFVALVLLLVYRRGRAFEVNLVPTENPGPGGAELPFVAAPDDLDSIGRTRHADTLPAPPLTVPHEPCKVCPARATRMMPASGRGERTARAGGALLGAAVELDHHGDRLYGQPRPEIIHTGPGKDLCEVHELVAFRLLENFHAGQRARMSTLTGTLALEAAAFEGGGMMRELKALAKGKARGKA